MSHTNTQSIRLGAVVLASGLSKRFGAQDKLFASLQGVPVLAHVLKTIQGVSLDAFAVVANAENLASVQDLCGEGAFVAVNKTPEQGMGTAISMGVKALTERDGALDGVLIVLGDMPLITPATYGHLRAVFEAAELGQGNQAGGHVPIVAPVCDGRRGHPVLFPRACFEALLGVSGPQGAKSVIDAYQGGLELCPVKDQGVLTDIDRTEDLAALQERV